MEAYTLVWYPDKEKPEVVPVKIHTKSGDSYIVKYLDENFGKKYQIKNASVIWFTFEEAKKVVDMERV